MLVMVNDTKVTFRINNTIIWKVKMQIVIQDKYYKATM